MKKSTSIMLCFLIVVFLVSCSQRKSQPPKEEKEKKQEEKKEEDKPEKKEGEKLLDSYMRALILRDDKIRLLYSENLKQQAEDFTSMPDPHPNGYKVDSVEEKEDKLQGTGKIYWAYTGRPYFSSDEIEFTVIKEKGSYVIDRIEKAKTTEISEKEKALFMKEEGDVKGKEIIKLDELPEFATPQGAMPDQKFTIGRESFGPVALDPEDKNMVLTTSGTYPAVMILDMKKKQVKPLDLYFEGSIQSVAWSQDGKFLAVEMSGPAGARFVNVYDIEKEKRIDDMIKDELKPVRYSVNSPYWISENELVFNVSGISTLTPDEQKKLGAYKFDVKNLSLAKF